MSDTLTIHLRKPLELAGQTWTEITLREPTVEEYDRAQQLAKSNVQISTHLIFLITGVPLAAVGKMGMRDFTRAADFIAGFMEGGPATGATGSPTSPAGTDGVPASAAA